MKTTVIHHSADHDGIFCREIARKFLPDAELIGWDFGDPLVPFPTEGTCYILDLNPQCVDASGCDADWIRRLIWIDHHKSAIENWPESIPGYRIDGVAACRLAWQWFRLNEHSEDHCETPAWGKEHFVNREVSEPLAVRLAGEYDIWDKRDPNAELFQPGLRSQPLDNVWEHLLSHTEISSTVIRSLLDQGRAIQYFQTKQNEDIITHYGFTIQFEGLTFLACNHARYNSHLFTAGLKPEHDACFGFKWSGKQWEVSLYHAPGKEHHDLSKIAVKFGGGGHRGACGFRIDKLPFLT